MRIEQALRFLHAAAKHEGLDHHQCMGLREIFDNAYQYVCAPKDEYRSWHNSEDAKLLGNGSVLLLRVGSRHLRAIFRGARGSKRSYRKMQVGVEFPFVNEP